MNTEINTEMIKPAGVLFALQKGDLRVPLKIAALFLPKDGAHVICALVWCGEQTFMHDTEVFPSENPRTPAVGYFRQLGQVLPDAARLEPLFSVVVFTKEVSNALRSAMRYAAISKDLVRNVFAKGAMKVRQLPRPMVREGRYRKSNRTFMPMCRRGYLSGDITNPVLEAAGAEVTLDHVAVARGKGRKAFAASDDGGLPIISSSGALVGFIVALADSGALILPAEDLEAALQVSFLTPERPPLTQGPVIKPRRAAA